MVSFRRFAMVLAVLACFAGVVSAQGSVTVPPTFTPSIIRSEGVTELLPTITFASTATANAGNFVITVYSSVAVTSATSEIKLTVGAQPYVGVVSGSSIVFGSSTSPVVIPAAASTIQLTGVRIKASDLPSLASGTATGIGENLLIVASPIDLASSSTLFASATPSPVYTVSNVAYALTSLAVGTSSTSPAPLVDSRPVLSICGTSFDPTATSLPTPTFYVSATEQYSGAFLNQAGEALGTTDTAATNGTRLQFTFTNLPSNTTLYVPATIGASPALALTIKSPAASTALSDTGVVAVPASGVVVYEVTFSTSGIDTAYIPVYVSFTGQAGITGTSIPTVTGQYAPASTTTSIPRFAGTPISSSAYTFTTSACTTSLLFPYLVSTDGYDTGIAIGNTATDPSGATSGQTGTCTYYFYGTGAPTDPYTSATVAPGSSTAVVLSSIAPGFQGYAVAQCDFNFAHGYAFVVNGTTQATASYLPLVLGTRGQGETLGN